ncbi:MAG: DMT family transporter [Armatimonadetes bacterium]|nr:DMT family transporter [Armatimonadota bacterium]
MAARRLPLPNFAMSVVVILWSYNYIALKFVYTQISPPAVALVRWIVTVAFFYIVAKAAKQDLTYPPGERSRYLLGGFLAFGLYMVLFLWGMNLTSPTEAAILLTTSPIWVQIFMALAKVENLRRETVAGAVIAFIGSVLVISGSGAADRGSLIGNVMVGVSAMVWAWSVMVMRTAIPMRPQLANFALALPGAGLALIPFGLTASIQQNWSGISPMVWLNFGHVIFLSGGVAMPLYYRGIEEVGPTQASLYQLLTPSVAALMQLLILKHPVTALQWVGIVVVFIGVMYGNLSARFARSPD